MTRVTAAPAPLVVEFVSGTRIEREAAPVSRLPIVQNGPPGTFVIFADGTRVPLPTDQIVSTETEAGGAGARVGFGGMRFAGVVAGQLVFLRVRDLEPEARLSPERSSRMTLEPHMVMAVTEDGHVVWPALH
jgi:hypothetical protein